MKNSFTVTIENVGEVCEAILNTDICHLNVSEDHRFAMEIKYLKDLLYRYRYTSQAERLQRKPSIEGVENLGQEFLQQTKHCLEYLDQMKKPDATP